MFWFTPAINIATYPTTYGAQGNTFHNSCPDRRKWGEISLFPSHSKIGKFNSKLFLIWKREKGKNVILGLLYLELKGSQHSTLIVKSSGKTTRK